MMSPHLLQQISAAQTGNIFIFHDTTSITSRMCQGQKNRMLPVGDLEDVFVHILGIIHPTDELRVLIGVGTPPISVSICASAEHHALIHVDLYIPTTR